MNPNQNAPAGIRIEIEVASAGELFAAVEAGADIVMLDNFTPEQVRRALAPLDPGQRPIIDAAGGIRPAHVRASSAAAVHSTPARPRTPSPPDAAARASRIASMASGIGSAARTSAEDSIRMGRR